MKLVLHDSSSISKMSLNGNSSLASAALKITISLSSKIGETINIFFHLRPLSATIRGASNVALSTM